MAGVNQPLHCTLLYNCTEQWESRDGQWESREGQWESREGQWESRQGQWESREGQWESREGQWGSRQGKWESRQGQWACVRVRGRQRQREAAVSQRRPALADAHDHVRQVPPTTIAEKGIEFRKIPTPTNPLTIPFVKQQYCLYNNFAMTNLSITYLSTFARCLRLFFHTGGLLSWQVTILAWF
jgi:hypothetical protein